MNLIKYIGKDYDKYNCFDLVKEFYKDHYDLDLSNYFEGPIPKHKEAESLIVSNKGHFIQVSKPVFGDIIVLNFFGYECHIGVVVSDTMFIHSAKGIGSCMEKMSRYGNMIAGYYRHRELTSD